MRLVGSIIGSQITRFLGFGISVRTDPDRFQVLRSLPVAADVKSQHILGLFCLPWISRFTNKIRPLVEKRCSRLPSVVCEALEAIKICCCNC